MMVQQYLPAVRDGDKRVLLIDGEAVGAINRVPPAGEARVRSGTVRLAGDGT